MTIREISQKLNISAATVSRILNSDASFSASSDTKKAVFEAAEKLGYDMTKLRKAKSGSKGKMVTCIMQSLSEKFVDSYYTAMLNGVFQELTKHHYSSEMFILGSLSGDNKQKALKDALNKSSDGVILLAEPKEDLLGIIEAHVKNIVCIDTGLTSFDNIRYNRFEAGSKAMQLLINKGHKKIAFVGSHIPYRFSMQFGRYDAYRMTMKQHNLPIDEKWIIDCNWQRETCFEMTLELMRLKERPTAIFFASDYMAIASAAAIRQAGLTIPGDVSIIGVSDIEEAKYLNPPLTTISIPQSEMGRIAAQTLINRINGDDTPPKQIYVPTELIIRSSVARPAQ